MWILTCMIVLEASVADKTCAIMLHIIGSEITLVLCCCVSYKQNDSRKYSLVPELFTVEVRVFRCALWAAFISFDLSLQIKHSLTVRSPAILCTLHRLRHSSGSSVACRIQISSQAQYSISKMVKCG
jgi:hypothetical protein